jgi:N-acetyl-gamma-glutamyl-phosphate reductase
MMHKIPVGVLGASGYAGRELCGIVLAHPSLSLAFAAAGARGGERARVAGRDITFDNSDAVDLGDAALVFSALPHGASAEYVARARAAGAKVVDLSADLRPGNANPAGAEGVPYGLTEVAREAVRAADVVANPGCYPTATLLALLPLLERKLVAPGGTISVSAASGVTGAGFTPRHDLLFGEVAEDFRAYGAGNVHRHLGEMRATFEAFHADADLVFTPHLLPVARGILATITVPLAERVENPLALWEDRFANEPFIEVSSELPTLKDVVRRNVVRVTAMHAQGTRRPTLVVIAAIDNLVKGAAGQAVQNANLMLGLDETAGLAA